MPEINTVIFDMDGLLIDSEPLWKEAADEVFAKENMVFTQEQYNATTGMRTYEFAEYWLKSFGRSSDKAQAINDEVIHVVTQKIIGRGEAMPGAVELVKKCKEKGFRTGIASSSPLSIIEMVVQKLDIGNYVEVLSSAEDLDYGKPHPQVFIECAKALGVDPGSCMVFEDSFNGMIAAKAARMYCTVVPAPEQFHEKKWAAANQKLSSLEAFDVNSLRG